MRQLKSALLMFAVLTVVTGVVYPLAVTVIAQSLFSYQANGSLIVLDGKAVGSEWIGQFFDDPKYFWGRLSATSPAPYNAAASSGSNYGPLHPSLKEAAQARIHALREAGAPAVEALVPVDLVTASASGLDPHISLAAARYQAPRVARARGLSDYQVNELIQRNGERRFLGILGEPVVNVLKLNLILDAYAKHKALNPTRPQSMNGLPKFMKWGFPEKL